MLGFERDGMMLVLAVRPTGRDTLCHAESLATVRRSVSGADIAAAVSAALGRQPGLRQR